jgi:hypothetical protein
LIELWSRPIVDPRPAPNQGRVVGPPAAIAGAVSDALQEFGVDVVDIPITPPKFRRWIAEARSGERAGRG